MTEGDEDYTRNLEILFQADSYKWRMCSPVSRVKLRGHD
jgi:hypothetical protein